MAPITARGAISPENSPFKANLHQAVLTNSLFFPLVRGWRQRPSFRTHTNV
jgi:hypothetical protein